ncbi:hypothetical protein [Nocardiopsis synnemataformans]|uniref:hypothetical protein n=1 Tax=Nocardiopsis synnemataformans TaxID=61305 RepID=UPI003EB97BC9
MSDAALLRRAAALAREVAMAAAQARPGPWHVAVDPHSNGPASSVRNCDRHVTGYVRPAIARHASLWHPGVATAVADWLEQHANEHDVYDCNWEAWACAALRTARALLEIVEPGEGLDSSDHATDVGEQGVGAQVQDGVPYDLILVHHPNLRVGLLAQDSAPINEATAIAPGVPELAIPTPKAACPRISAVEIETTHLTVRRRPQHETPGDA